MSLKVILMGVLHAEEKRSYTEELECRKKYSTAIIFKPKLNKSQISMSNGMDKLSSMYVRLKY